MSISEFDLRQMTQRTERARNPAAAKAKDEAAKQKHAAGQERELSRIFCADLTRRGIPHIVARTDRKSTIADGWPDVTAMYAQVEFPTDSTASSIARVCCVELKAATGRLSPAQEACHAHLRAAGIPVCVAWDLQTAIEFVKKHLHL